ncbi:hypothetical protein LSH36_372g02004, partial [Paralvinella palmiformis]
MPVYIVTVIHNICYVLPEGEIKSIHPSIHPHTHTHT